jgi:glycosyltransferase involved in cell wall biosynthesis
MGDQVITVSIALCTYNGSKYLKEQLESIQRQTILPNELVICDDCSQDETIAILHEFQTCSNIKTRIYSNSVNLGFTRNFEQALRLCQGDLVFMADQDDIWIPGKIDQVIRMFLEFPKLIGVTHDGRLVDEEGRWFGTTKWQQIVRGYGKDNGIITGALSCIRSSGLDIILPFPEGVNGHDTWLTYVFSWFHERWLFSYECLQDIRRHSRNTSDWVGNSFQPIGRIDVIKSQIQTKTAISYSDRIVMNSTLFDRLQCASVRSLSLECFEVSACLFQLKKERIAIQQRQAIADQPNRLARWILAIRFLLAGKYIYFNGLRSFVRDMAR